MRKIVNILANKLYFKLFSNIGLDDKQKQIVIYMLNVLLKNSLMWVTVFIITFPLGIFWNTLAFMLTFMAIRYSFGGWHSKNEYLCFIISISASILAGSIPKILTPNVIIFGTIYLFALITALKVGVVDNPTKRLSPEKKKRFKKRGLLILFVVFITNVVLFNLGLAAYSIVVLMGVLIGFVNLLFAR